MTFSISCKMKNLLKTFVIYANMTSPKVLGTRVKDNIDNSEI